MALGQINRKIKSLSQELDKLRPISTEDEQRIMQKFRLDWNFHSNHIEGNSLSYGETKALILFGITAQGKPMKDHIEMEGHNEAVKYIEEVVKQDRPLTENFIREIHTMILKERYQTDAITSDGQPTKKWVEVGEYKSTPNHVKTSTGEIFRFASPEETPAKMEELMNWYKKSLKDKKIKPLFFATEFHYRFVRIHPFDDGNGRMARILMNFILMQMHLPPAIIPTGKREEYYSALSQADAGNLEIFFNYIGDRLIHSLDLMVRGANGEDIEESGDLEKEVALLKEELKKEPEIKIAKSQEIIIRQYNESFRPLFETFHKKLNQFDEMFFEKTDYCGVNVNKASEDGDTHLSYADKFIKNQQKVLNILQEQKNPDAIQDTKRRIIEINNFVYTISWEGFKKKKEDPFSLQVGIEIKLEKFKYNISSYGSSIIKPTTKLYEENISKKEAEGMAEQFIRYVLKHIKKQLGKE